jgi:putative hydrolase of the HAD superfamily
MPQGKKLLLLDLDNTLWDFDGNAEDALHELFHRHHLHLRSEYKVHEFVTLYQRVNKSFWKRYEKGEIDKGYLRTERFAETFRQMGIPDAEHPEQAWEEYIEICPAMKRLIPGAIEFLKEVHAHCRIGIVTNGFEATQHKKVANTGIDAFMDFMITSEGAGIPKPQAGIFEKALELGGAKSSDSLYMGDTWDTDILGGTGAGIPCLWFNPGNHPLPEPGPGKLYLGHVESLPAAAGVIMGWAQL